MFIVSFKNKVYICIIMSVFGRLVFAKSCITYNIVGFAQ